MSSYKQRRGAANTYGLALLGGLALLAALGAILAMMNRTAGSPASRFAGDGRAAAPSLTLYCASGIRLPIERIAAAYQESYGGRINIQFGGSNTLLSQLEIAHSGDLFLAADESYAELARQKGLVRETLPLASMRAVIVVPAGNPKRIAGLADLLRGDVRASVGNPDQAAIGKVVRDVLEPLGKWRELESAVTARGVFQATVSEVVNSVKLGAIDAGIVWDTSVANEPQLAMIAVPELAGAVGRIALGILTSSRQPRAALHFARFAAARDRGLPIFQQAGYEVVDGDAWADAPELTFFCGAVNRRAVEPAIAEFERREGVRVNTVYNGCGILTGQMKVIADWQQGRGFPDTYLACDRYYLEVVKDQFQDAAELSETAVVIAVPPGNPQKIRALQDLTRDGLRLAVGQPKQCTIGVLTRNILQSEGVQDAVLKNVVAETCSSALLLPLVATGAVDAAFVYESDTRAAQEQVEIVRIASPLAIAIQPFSIAKSSRNKWLSRRLLQTLARHKEQFESAGFRWRLNASPGATKQ